MSRQSFGFTTNRLSPEQDEDWRKRSACKDESPELFFAVGTSGPALMQIAQAKAVCWRCPVSDQCLEWSLTAAGDGVWAGLTEEERSAERLRRKQTTAAAA